MQQHVFRSICLLLACTTQSADGQPLYAHCSHSGVVRLHVVDGVGPATVGPGSCYGE